MTVLYSFYSSAGIIFAADRRLTETKSRSVRGKRISSTFHSEGDPKILRAPVGTHRRGGLIGYFGHALVGQKPMYQWLDQFCSAWTGSRDPRVFAAGLVEGLMADGHPWRSKVTGFHLGAMVIRAGRTVPSFWFVRNGQISPATQRYHRFSGQDWAIEEQLLDRDYLGLSPVELRNQLRARETQLGVPYWYTNGDLPAFAHVRFALEQAAAFMIHQPQYRPPSDLKDWSKVAQAFVVTAISLADATFGGGAPRIGGLADALELAWN